MGIFKSVFKRNKNNNIKIGTFDIKNTLSNIEDMKNIISNVTLDPKFMETNLLYEKFCNLSDDETKDYYKEKFVDNNVPVTDAYTFEIIFNPYSEEECKKLGEPYLGLYKMKYLITESLRFITFYNFAYLYLKENNRLEYECNNFPMEIAAINGMIAPSLAIISISKDSSLRQIEGLNEMREYWGFDNVYDWANNTRIHDKKTVDNALFDELWDKYHEIITTEYNAENQGVYYATLDYIKDANIRIMDNLMEK